MSCVGHRARDGQRSVLADGLSTGEVRVQQGGTGGWRLSNGTRTYVLQDVRRVLRRMWKERRKTTKVSICLFVSLFLYLFDCLFVCFFIYFLLCFIVLLNFKNV